MPGGNLQLLFFGVVILLLIGLMFRNSRKRQRDQQALSDGLKPGAEIMTTFGVFGTIQSFDDEHNKVVIETGPGSTLTIHRQAVGKLVPVESAAATEVNGAPLVLDDAAADPEFGERVETRESGADASRADDAPNGPKA